MFKASTKTQNRYTVKTPAKIVAAMVPFTTLYPIKNIVATNSMSRMSKNPNDKKSSILCCVTSNDNDKDSVNFT